MDAITYGAENVFRSAGTNYIDVCVLDSTHFVIAFQGQSGYGYAIAGSISGETITYGTAVAFNSTDANDIKITALDSTHFVVIYDEGVTGYAIIGLVSGTTISSYGSALTFGSSNADKDVAAIDSTHFVVSWRVFNTGGYCRIGLVSGTTISSYGTATLFTDVNVRDISVAKMDSTHFVVAFCDVDTYQIYDDQCCRIGVVSGTTISSYGAKNYFINGETMNDMSVISLTDEFFVAASGGVTRGACVIGQVSGSTISYGTINDFISEDVGYISICKLDNIYFVVSSVSLDIDFTVASLAGETDETTINEYGSDGSFATGNNTFIQNDAFTDTHFIVSYKSSSGYGCARIGSFPVQFTPQVIIS